MTIEEVIIQCPSLAGTDVKKSLGLVLSFTCGLSACRQNVTLLHCISSPPVEKQPLNMAMQPGEARTWLWRSLPNVLAAATCVAGLSTRSGVNILSSLIEQKNTRSSGAAFGNDRKIIVACMEWQFVCRNKFDWSRHVTEPASTPLTEWRGREIGPDFLRTPGHISSTLLGAAKRSSHLRSRVAVGSHTRSSSCVLPRKYERILKCSWDQYGRQCVWPSFQ